MRYSELSQRDKMSVGRAVLVDKKTLTGLDDLFAIIGATAIRPSAGHHLISQYPEEARKALYLQGITSAKYFSQGDSAIVFEIPGQQLLKINPAGSARTHFIDHPALLGDVTVAEVAVDNWNKYRVTCQAKINKDITDSEIAMLENALGTPIDSEDAGVFIYDGKRVPVVFDIHREELPEHIPASSPNSLWVDADGQWVQHKAYPELQKQCIKGTVSIETAVGMINAMRGKEVISYKACLNMVKRSPTVEDAQEMIHQLCYDLSPKEKILLKGYYAEELAEIFGKDIWEKAMHASESGTLDASHLNTSFADLEAAEQRVIAQRSALGHQTPVRGAFAL